MSVVDSMGGQQESKTDFFVPLSARTYHAHSSSSSWPSDDTSRHRLSTLFFFFFSSSLSKVLKKETESTYYAPGGLLQQRAVTAAAASERTSNISGWYWNEHRNITGLDDVSSSVYIKEKIVGYRPTAAAIKQTQTVAAVDVDGINIDCSNIG